MATREFTDDGGDRWVARIISGGRSSAYLNQRVQRPIVQFDRVGRHAASRYAMLGAGLPDSVAELAEENLRSLLARSLTH